MLLSREALPDRPTLLQPRHDGACRRRPAASHDRGVLTGGTGQATSGRLLQGPRRMGPEGRSDLPVADGTRMQDVEPVSSTAVLKVTISAAIKQLPKLAQSGRL